MDKKKLTVLAVGSGVLISSAIIKTLLDKKNNSLKVDTPKDYRDDFNSLFQPTHCQRGFHICPYNLNDLSEYPKMSVDFLDSCYRGFEKCPFTEDVPSMSVPMFSDNISNHSSLRDALDDENFDDADMSQVQDNDYPSIFSNESEFRKYCDCSSDGAIEYIIGVSDRYELEELKHYSLTDLGKLYLSLYIINEKDLNALNQQNDVYQNLYVDKEGLQIKSDLPLSQLIDLYKQLF